MNDKEQAPDAGDASYVNHSQEVEMGSNSLIAVMGPTGSGKSSFIKGITGRQDIKVGHTLHSETSKVSSYDTTIDSKSITLIDTPGFDDSSVSDLEILRILSQWLQEHSQDGQLLTGIIYLHPITKTRLEGSALRALTVMKKLCGIENLKNVLLVTSFWNEVAADTGHARELELVSTNAFWKQMVEQGSRVERLSRDYERFKPVLAAMATCVPMKLGMQTEIQEGKSLEETMAGLFLNAEAKKIEEEHESEMRDLNQWWKENLIRSERKLKAETAARKKEADDALAAIKSKETEERLRLAQREQLQKYQQQMKVKALEKQQAEAAERAAERERLIMEEEERAARKRREDDGSARYKDSELQRKVVDADINLLRAAHAAGLCRVSIRGINPRGAGLSEDGEWTVDRTAINSWCDRCRHPVGNRGRIVCMRCPAGEGVYNLCHPCHGDAHARCLNEDHQLFLTEASDHFKDNTCSRASQQFLNIHCDRQDCRRAVKGVYFHCCRCDGDDFDLCLQCVVRGRGCRDDTHWLEWAVAPIDIATRAG